MSATRRMQGGQVQEARGRRRVFEGARASLCDLCCRVALLQRVHLRALILRAPTVSFKQSTAVVGEAPFTLQPVCIRTLRVSNGCPTKAAAAPEIPPATNGKVHDGNRLAVRVIEVSAVRTGEDLHDTMEGKGQICGRAIIFGAISTRNACLTHPSQFSPRGCSKKKSTVGPCQQAGRCMVLPPLRCTCRRHHAVVAQQPSLTSLKPTASPPGMAG
jgi:hypothetical protein